MMYSEPSPERMSEMWAIFPQERYGENMLHRLRAYLKYPRAV